jgi:hypothetical protein
LDKTCLRSTPAKADTADQILERLNPFNYVRVNAEALHTVLHPNLFQSRSFTEQQLSSTKLRCIYTNSICAYNRVYIVDSLKLVHKLFSCDSEDRYNRGKLGCKLVGESLGNTEDEPNNIKVCCIPCQSQAEPILKSSRGRPCGGAERRIDLAIGELC